MPVHPCPYAAYAAGGLPAYNAAAPASMPVRFHLQTHAGLPLVDGSDRQQSTSRVHTYAETWAYQADGYEPVYYKHSSFV
jgi:hypothetical protein